MITIVSMNSLQLFRVTSDPVSLVNDWRKLRFAYALSLVPVVSEPIAANGV